MALTIIINHRRLEIKKKIVETQKMTLIIQSTLVVTIVYSDQ